MRVTKKRLGGGAGGCSYSLPRVIANAGKRSSRPGNPAAKARAAEGRRGARRRPGPVDREGETGETRHACTNCEHGPGEGSNPTVAGEGKKGRRVKTNYVLIDYENVQPKNLAVLNGHSLKDEYPFKVLVFVGANQEKLPYEIAASLQALGADATYIKIGGNGNNALDFHIAFYIGQLAERDPGAYFHIISKDTGFDPLIKHLKGMKISVQREKDMSEIPLLKISNASSSKEKMDAIVKNLASRGHTRPRKVKTLANTINSLFRNTLEAAEVTSLIEELCKKRYVVKDNDKVSYNLPASQP